VVVEAGERQQGTVPCRSRLNRSLGCSLEARDPLEGLARLTDRFPNPGQHQKLFCTTCANRARGARRRRRSALVFCSDPAGIGDRLGAPIRLEASRLPGGRSR